MANSITGVLYIVATPIGNLSDISFHAVEILKKVDLIIAEDTRNTSILLNKYQIKTKLKSYHKFCECEKSDIFLDKIETGANIALVSDAGTPLISDPGNILVKKAIERGIKIVPIGGISAVTTLLSAVSRKGEDFKFIGFLPKIRGQIEEIFKKNAVENLVFYESPNRIMNTFKIIKEIRPNSIVSIGRELTKKFEEIKTANIADIIDYYENNPAKGEFICLIHKEIENRNTYRQKVEFLKKAGFSQKDTVKIFEVMENAPKNLIKSMYN